MAKIDLLTAERKRKLESLKTLNIDAYPHAFAGKIPTKMIQDKYSALAIN